MCKCNISYDNLRHLKSFASTFFSVPKISFNICLLAQFVQTVQISGKNRKNRGKNRPRKKGKTNSGKNDGFKDFVVQWHTVIRR